MRDNAGQDPTWVDSSFPFPESIWWEDMRVASPDDYSSVAASVSWNRLSDVFDTDVYSLWGSNGISAADVVQGGIGNCWL